MFKNLPWASSHDEKAKDNDQNSSQNDQSLTTILGTAEDRTNLLLLIANCTDTLRQNILDNFDPEKTNRVPKLPPRPTSSDDVEEKTAEEIQQEEKDAADREKAEHERRIKELASQQMQELKKAALSYYDEWRDRVLERVGEAINERPPSTTPTKPSSTSINAPKFSSFTTRPVT